MAGISFSIQVLIQVCLLRRVSEFSQAHSCQIVRSIGFLWDHGPECGSLKKNRSLRLLQGYASNAVSEYQAYADNVNDAPQRVESTKSTIFLGDFNAHVGTDNETWKGVNRSHGDPAFNKNGRYLLQLCCRNGLCITNIFFQHKDIHKYTEYRPSISMVQKYLIDISVVSSSSLQ